MTQTVLHYETISIRDNILKMIIVGSGLIDENLYCPPCL